MLQQLKTLQPIYASFKEYDWKVRKEDELMPLHTIKVLADIMHLTYKRRDKLFLSKNGKSFLNSLSPIDQYLQLVLHYWYRANWSHFSVRGWVRDDKLAVCEILQQEQNFIWQAMLAESTNWIDYKAFCITLGKFLHLDQFLQESYSTPEETFARYVRHIIFDDNLLFFGLVEAEMKQGKTKWDKDIVRFRTTQLGRFVCEKALFETPLYKK